MNREINIASLDDLLKLTKCNGTEITFDLLKNSQSTIDTDCNECDCCVAADMDLLKSYLRKVDESN